MKLTTLTLSENRGLARTHEPITVGVPFPPGVCHSLDQIQLQHPSNGTLALQKKRTGRWPDGSVQWALIDFQTALQANETLYLDVLCLEEQSMQAVTLTPDGITVEETEQAFSVNTGAATFTVNKQKFTVIDQASIAEKAILDEGEGGFYLSGTSDDPNTYTTEITQIEANGGPQKLTIIARGNIVTNESIGSRSNEKKSISTLARFQSTTTFYAHSATVKIDFTVHNPKAAEHENNMWDLGDPGSIFFKSLGLQLVLNNNNNSNNNSNKKEKTLWRADGLDEWQAVNGAKFSLYQDSSGGEHWNYKTHKNSKGEIPLTFRGYQVREDGEKISEGLRASPCVSTPRLTAHIHKFWQNFPKGLSLENNVLRFELFPEAFADNYELQGGEKKTHTLSLSFSGEHEEKSALDTITYPVRAVLPLDYYAQCQAIQHLEATHSDSPMNRLVATGLEDTKNNYFLKREVIDEYGWRNFGDIFADHECLYLKQGEPPFVSHYNNQYDSLYGFLRQFAATGDPRWFELADDLATHITDIDIYDTLEDRDEYNGGLFWHTGHYLDADTCSHRSYAKSHYDESNPERLGGGPGSEHCYSTGLLYHHYFTGCEASKKAVLTLAKWITYYYEGSGTFLSGVQQFKNVRLPQLKQALTGKADKQKISPHRYPLDRGVGNYINTLIDAFHLTEKHTYIQQIEQIIRNTVHPGDNLEDRQFDDIEGKWFYTIFFQAVIRYLGLKEVLKEYDADYHYARTTLLVYARWMANNEKTYLSNPDVLEYPNDTWAAQDIRKANILFYAALYSTDNRQAFLDKARYFYDYVTTTLTASDTRHFSRILAILMQNHGPNHEFFDRLVAEGDSRAVASDQVFKIEELRHLSTSQILKQTVVDFAKLLVRFNLKKELRWLSVRSPAVKRLLRRTKIVRLTQVK